jgi:SAM-dependent methyltransferase
MKLIYTSINERVLNRVPRTAKTILDIGCGNGALGEEIKKRQACSITGITYSEEEAVLAKRVLDDVVVCDLNFDPLPDMGKFELIICSHVLEHLCYPDLFLRNLRHQVLKPHRVIVALPNALAWRQRIQFLLGRFRYQQSGIMDKTHLRFFDKSTAKSLIVDAGYKLVAFESEGVMPLSRFCPFGRRRLDLLAGMIAPGLTAQQFIMECEAAD